MTKTAKHSILFRLWIRLRGLLAFVIVLFGVVVGVVSLILPNEELYKPYVVDFLSKQWNKKVEISQISGKWKGFGPKFIIKGLVIKDSDEVIVQEATLDINLLKYIVPKGSTGIRLGVSDIEVDFERKTSGKIVLVQSPKKKESFSRKLEKLLSTGSLSVNNLSLNLYDSENNKANKINSKITVQQNNASTAFELELDSPDLADKFIIKSIAQKSQNFMEKANWYVEVDNLLLENLGDLLNKKFMPKATIDASMWFSTQNGDIDRLLAKADLNKKLFKNDRDITGKAELVYKGSRESWKAELTINDIQTQSISQDQIKIKLVRDKGFISIHADVLDVPLLKAITHVLGISLDDFDQLELKGQLANVVIVYDLSMRRISQARIQFKQLDFAAAYAQLHNLSGEISLYDEQIRLLIDSSGGSAKLPGIIRGTVTWQQLLLTAQTSMQDDDLDIKINSMWCDCTDFILDGAARFSYDQSLFMDLSFAIYQAKVEQLYKYWPSIKWKPKVLNFLDQALAEGVVEKGMILYHGLTREYPFKGNEGVFLTRSDLRSATVNYHKQWPAVQNFEAIVQTINTQLLVESQKGQVMDARIDGVKAVIKDFKKPLLTVDVQAHGQDGFLIDFLKKSPMRKGLKVLKEDIDLKGPQSIQVGLTLPLKQHGAKVVPVGHIDFRDTDFQMGQFQLQNLKGALAFEGFSLSMDQLQAQFLNQQVSVSGKITNEPNKASQIDVELAGDYDVKNFESVLGIQLPAQGISPWTFTISNSQPSSLLLEGFNKDERLPLSFTASSALQGVELEMPEPFAKAQDLASSFSISCHLPCQESGWDMKLDDKLSTRFKLDPVDQSLKIDSLAFGSDESQQTGFGGNLDTVNVDEWISIVVNNSAGKEKGQLPFENMTLQVKKLIFMSRELLDVSVQIISNEKGLIFEVDAESIQGSVSVPKDLDNKGITVQLQRLYWADPPKETTEHSISGVNANYPALHIWIDDFIYDGIPLGESSIEMRPVTGGVRVEKFRTVSSLMKLNINGVWIKDQGQYGLSQFNIIMTSKNIAEFLANLGFQAPIKDAQTIIDMQAQWPGFPSQFEIKNISGKMRIEVGQGEVVDAKPGMGRVLGLFSLTNLPRRFLLDFKDVFGKGLRFQSMKGDFILENGEAFTDSFVIDSSSAKIKVMGTTGLAKQDYNQTVVVTPGVGRVLPTIGAITGGAVGAAAGLFVQGLFHKGLKNVGKITYKVTGSWDEPDIKLIDTEELK